MGRRVDSCSDSGWVLFDVLAALAVLGILLGSLAGGINSVIAREAAVRKAAVDLVDTSRSDDTPWTWRSVHLATTWTPGPRLEVRLLADTSAASYQIGVWADGWLLIEQEIGEDGRLILDPHMWEVAEGDEVILRVGAQGHVWGPPWRIVVPDSAGVLHVAGGPTPEDGAGEAFIHIPSAAEPDVEIVDSFDRPAPGANGLPQHASGFPDGTAGVSLGDSVQSWRSEPGRSLDVYY